MPEEPNNVIPEQNNLSNLESSSAHSQLRSSYYLSNKAYLGLRDLSIVPPGPSELSMTDYILFGDPMVHVASIDTESLDFSFEGDPFIATFSASAASAEGGGGEGGDSEHSFLYLSTYQFISGTSATVEDIFLTDYITGIDLFPIPFGTDPASILDQFSADNNRVLTDYITGADAFEDDEIDVVLTDYISGADDFSGGVNEVVLTEYITGHDVVFTPGTRNPFESTGTLILQVREQITSTGTYVAQVKGDLNVKGTLEFYVKNSELAPVVASASGADNPFHTTVVNNGVVLYSHPTTLPSVIPPDWCGVKYDPALIVGDMNYSQIYDWTYTQDGAVGNFTVSASAGIAAYDEEITLFGLPGVVKKKRIHEAFNDSSVTSKGVIGVPNLNKQITTSVTGNNVYRKLIPSQELYIPARDDWGTHRDASMYIASFAGIELQWTIPDLPLRDFQGVAGMTVIEALNSLAEGAAGKLRPNGANRYVVLFPDEQTGVHELPDCCLLTDIGEECNTDLIRNLYSPGIELLSKLPEFDTSTTTADTDPAVTGNGGGYQTEIIYTARQIMTDEDPPLVIDLPVDFESVYVVNRTNTDGTGIYTRTASQLEDPPFLLQTGFSGRYINYNDVNGVLKPQVTIDSSLFPQENEDALEGHFFFYVHVLRKSLQGAYEQAQQEALAKEQEALGRTQAQYRFIPVCVIEATYTFFGAIPQPGMKFIARTRRRTYEGIIESVTVQGTRGRGVVVSIVAIQWQRLNLLSPLDVYTNGIEDEF